MRSSTWLHRYSIMVAACTLFLIFAGGLVTSTGSGLAVPDWPLSYGQLFPPMVGGIFYEHGHRLIAATVGLLTMVLAVWLWKSEPRPWVRRLGLFALSAVILQGVLGGITVLLLLPTPVSVSHAGLAQLFFCLTVSIAVFTSPSWQAATHQIEDHDLPSLKTLATMTSCIIYLQILVGAWMRHTNSGLAIPDFPLSYGHWFPPFFSFQIAVHFAHRIGAIIVLSLVTWTCLRVFRSHRKEKSLLIPALSLLLLSCLQIILGALTIWTGRAVTPTTLHVAFGAATLASSLILTLRTHRLLLSPFPRPPIKTAFSDLPEGSNS